jgi:ADP-heptose:LPS heptosyltransferase
MSFFPFLLLDTAGLFPSRAVLVRLGGLGDLLVALPSIGLVRRALPGSRLVLVGRRDYGLLLERAGLVDEAVSADGRSWAPLLAAGLAEGPASPPSPEVVVPAPGPADLVLGWFHGAPGGEEPDREPSPGPGLVVFRCDPREPRPLVRAFFEKTERFFRGRGAPAYPFEECARLPAGGGTESRGRALAGPGEGRARFAVVHPGSGGRSKRWPLDRFLAVVSRLAEGGFGGLLATGEAEAGLEEDIRERTLPEGWTWRPNPPLADLAGCLATADLYLGNDSGVTHLAAACGAPVVALFRDEFKDAWRPEGDVRVLSAPDVAEISVPAVLEAVFSRAHR